MKKASCGVSDELVGGTCFSTYGPLFSIDRMFVIKRPDVFSINPMFLKNIEVFAGEKRYKQRITLKYPPILQFTNLRLIISLLS